MQTAIDLNADLGESFGPWTMGRDADILGIVTSANVACGGHASDPDTMFHTLSMAAQNGVAIGAHPGYADKLGFGRRVIPMKNAEISRMVAAQIGALQGVANLVPVKVRYVKTHGALANLGARDPAVAGAIIEAVLSTDPTLAILAISGTHLETEARKRGAHVFSEIFADRGYLSSGQLVPRDQPGAMIHDAKDAALRLLSYLSTGTMPVVDGDPIPLNAQSICVHGDGPSAVAMATEVKLRLQAEGVTIQSFLSME